MSDIWPITFDAKKIAFRQSKDGIVLSLVVHPNSDCIAVLAAAEIGFDFQVTVCPMLESPAGGTTGKEMASQAPAGVAKTEGERAVQRAAILSENKDFIGWVRKKYGGAPVDAAEFIRASCKIRSRADLRDNTFARAEFERLEREFRNRVDHCYGGKHD